MESVQLMIIRLVAVLRDVNNCVVLMGAGLLLLKWDAVDLLDARDASRLAAQKTAVPVVLKDFLDNVVDLLVVANFADLQDFANAVIAAHLTYGLIVAIAAVLMDVAVMVEFVVVEVLLMGVVLLVV